jgi:hypothetical protein
MPQNRPPKAYLTAGEVKKLLGITNGMLYNFIDNGALERVVPPGRKQGVYLREQVEQLARDLQVFISTRYQSKIKFRKATKQDIAKCMEIGMRLHPNAQQGITSLENRLQWLDKNPDLYYVIDYDNEIVGYTSIVPLRPEKIQEILNSDELAMDITPEEIEEFKPGKPLHIYIATMRTIPNITRTEKRLYGVRLVGGLITTIIGMVENGIEIDTLYANSDTVDGIRILKHMKFTEIPSKTRSRNYILKMAEQGEKLLKKYKYAFNKS